MAIKVYNMHLEDHNGDYNYYIGRKSPVGNPFTHIKDKDTLADFVLDTREECLEAYSRYFDMAYGRFEDFTNYIDQIYELYKRGEDVYLGCFCHPKPCHGDIIVDKLRARLIKEKLNSNPKN
jgi:hypothetical protein